jgi:hypothetical protein
MEWILGAIAVAALVGWTATNALLSRGLLPMANAFRVLIEVDHKIDQRINAVLDRARANTKRPEVPSGKPEAPKPPPFNPAVFSSAGPPLIPNYMESEQPDSLESADA